MEKSTAELTNEYINEHPYIKACLRQGLVNYSALSRFIARELDIEKKTSKEAILIAARRLHLKLERQNLQDKDIMTLLKGSEIELKTKIMVAILDKSTDLDAIDGVQKAVWRDSGIFYILTGSNNYTIIMQEKHAGLLDMSKAQKVSRNLVMINIKSGKEIETTPGVISFLTALFAQNGVNIVEFLSCWTDTIFIIASKDLEKAINFLSF